MKACPKSPLCSRAAKHTGRCNRAKLDTIEGLESVTGISVESIEREMFRPTHVATAEPNAPLFIERTRALDFVDLALNIGLGRSETLLRKVREASRTIEL